MKKLIILMTVLAIGAVSKADVDTLEISVSAEVVKPVSVTPNGDYDGTFFLSEGGEYTKSVDYTIDGEDDSSVEVRLDKEVRLNSGGEEAIFQFSIAGESPDGDQIYKEIGLSSSGSAVIAIDGKLLPKTKSDSIPLGVYTGSVTLEFKYI